MSSKEEVRINDKTTYSSSSENYRKAMKVFSREDNKWAVNNFGPTKYLLSKRKYLLSLSTKRNIKSCIICTKAK